MLTAEERERGRRLGAALRQARGGRSMGEIAARAGVPVETLRKIETGRIPTPAFFTVAALAAALDLDLSRLVSETVATPAALSA
jgi:transcriptional regulator with XRE-family HTH domain